MKNLVVNDSVSSEEAQAACEVILASEKFAHAPRMCRLLQYLVESAISGNCKDTCEYAIGIAVFGRDALTYCTNEDPSVRVQVGRLREKLKDYYANFNSEIEISIPLGTYMPKFRRLIQASEISGDMQLYSQPVLNLRSIECFSSSDEDISFAQGLQEELLHQLYKSLGWLNIVQLFDGHLTLESSNEGNGYDQVHVTHILETGIRIDNSLTRITARLKDPRFGKIFWSEQFDSKKNYGIAMQEELANAICQGVKDVLRDNGSA